MRVAFTSASFPDFGFEALDLAEVVHRVGEAHLAMPRRLEFCQLIALHSGSAVQEIDFVRYEIRPGMVVFTSPGQVQRLVVSKDCRGPFLLFKPEFVSAGRPGVSRQGVGFSDIAPLIQSTPAIANAIQVLTEEYSLLHRDRISRMIIVHEAAALLLRLRRESESALGQKSSPTEAYALFRKFELLVEEKFTDHRSASMLARELACSERTLRRACLGSTGQPPKALVQQRVALEAKRVLAHTDQPVKVIADQLGFSEPPNFVKFFRRVAGELPSAFRLRVQAAERYPKLAEITEVPGE